MSLPLLRAVLLIAIIGVPLISGLLTLADSGWMQLKYDYARSGRASLIWPPGVEAVDYVLVKLFSANLCIASNPLLLDVDGDSVNDIVVPSCDGHTYAYSVVKHKILWVAPDGEGLVSPCAGDIDGDGTIEVIVPAGGYLAGIDSRSGHVEWLIKGLFYRQSPVIADFDGDGIEEVAESSLDGKLYMIEGHGNVSAVLSLTSDPLGTPSAGDVNGDRDLEIVVGTVRVDPTSLYVVEVKGGSLKIIQNVRLEGAAYGYPTVVDIDSDGNDEVLFATTSYLYVLRFSGSPQLLWKASLPGTTYTSPTVADVNADGLLDVLVPTDGGLVIYRYDGFLEGVYSDVNAAYGGVIASDLDGDGFLELVVAEYDGEVDIVDMQSTDYYNGTLNLFLTGAPIMAPVSVGDVDGDRVPEVIFGSRDFNVYMIDINFTVKPTTTGMYTFNETTGLTNPSGGARSVSPLTGTSLENAPEKGTTANLYAIVTLLVVAAVLVLATYRRR